MSLWGFYGPSAQGLMTKRVGQNEQGQLQGALSSIMGVTGILGPGLFSLVFAGAIDSRRSWHMPGAPFLLASGMLVVSVVLAIRVTRESS